VRTLEKKKIDFPDIYDGWLCPICGLENETFNHIWTCKENRNFVSSWVDKIKAIILESVDDKKVAMGESLIMILNDMDIWNIRDFEDIEDLTFNFIDMIKGIIPMSLTAFIKKYKIQGCEINSIYEKIFTFLLENSTNSVWVPRCVELNSLEKELGLTRQMKINSRYGEYSKKFDHNSQ
ncbi:hypothetical protein RhiirA4_489185, partial [Rhizophagus irregularis]